MGEHVCPLIYYLHSAADLWCFHSLQINNLSTSLLSLLLAPRLIETAAKFNVVPRLVLVSSEVHYWSEVPKAILDKPSMLEALSDEAYCMSGFVESPSHFSQAELSCSGMKGRYELSKREYPLSSPWSSVHHLQSSTSCSPELSHPECLLLLLQPRTRVSVPPNFVET